MQRLFDTFNHGDLGPIDELVVPAYRGAQGDQGPAGFKAVVVGLRTAFPVPEGVGRGPRPTAPASP